MPAKPSRPKVSHPQVWSRAVRQLLTQAEHEALESLIEKERWTFGSAKMEQKVLSDPATKREFYELVLHFIPRVNPSNGFSPKGPPVDRAEARLRIWEVLYGTRKVA